jgi:hypothetical protein
MPFPATPRETAQALVRVTGPHIRTYPARSEYSPPEVETYWRAECPAMGISDARPDKRAATERAEEIRKALATFAQEQREIGHLGGMSYQAGIMGVDLNGP